MILKCTNCNTSLDISPEHFGRTLQCPSCNVKLRIAAPEINQSPRRSGWVEKDHANVHFMQSLGIGVIATVVFLLAMVPLRDMRTGSIFLDRGWVNYAETFLFFWAITMLVLKAFKNKHQNKASLISLFPEHLGTEISSHTVTKFIDNIYATPAKLRDSIFVNRIRKALELFELRNSNHETSEFLATQSDLDANRSLASYSIIKVFLWAIPILGFIGTVMGLSDAVGSLSIGGDTDPEALEQSISNLTSGLGVAFDTTLLGLILSILLSFPLSIVQKKEDETLTLIDTFCTEKLLPKLNDSASSSQEMALSKAGSIPELINALAQTHESFLRSLQTTSAQMKQNSETSNQLLMKNYQLIESSFAASVNKLNQRSSELFQKSDQELDATFKRLELGVDLINQSLKKLGDEGSIPTTKKRGFFSR